MNPYGDFTWYINERINEAHKCAENCRLAQEAKGTQPQRSGNRLRKVRTIALLASGLVPLENLFAVLRLGLKGEPHHA